ncbi:MAG: isochorismatase family protein [Rhodovibrionaceae bacterium]
MSDDLRIFDRQGFGGELGFGERPALLIVDFVNGFNDPEIFGGGNIPQAIASTKPLLDLFREKKLPVVFTRIVYAEDGSNAGMFARKAPRLLELTEDAPMSHVVPELQPWEGEIVLNKRNASSFFGTTLDEDLRKLGVDTVVVTGCTTSGCVRASVVDAVSHDFSTVVVREGVGDRAEGPHKASLLDMEKKYADVLDLKIVIELVEGH